MASNPERWNDFSDVDAILAVRSFGSKYYTSKPPTKLYNSWHAGVPAILGCEGAFRAERKSELDYIEVSSVNDALLALARLRDDKELRHAMVENGLVRDRETQPATILKRWRNFLTDVAVPAYERWCKASSWNRQTYTARCYLTIKENNLQPHPLYLHDTDITDNEQLGIQNWALISTIQLYRNLKRNVKNLGF